MAKVVLTEPAKHDLLDIEKYIYIELCNPQAAIKITNGIVDVIKNLRMYPMRHAYVNDANLRRRGVRRAQYDNYNIFYYFENDIVYILRILYSRADWKNILK